MKSKAKLETNFDNTFFCAIEVSIFWLSFPISKHVKLANFVCRIERLIFQQLSSQIEFRALRSRKTRNSFWLLLDLIRRLIESNRLRVTGEWESVKLIKEHMATIRLIGRQWHTGMTVRPLLTVDYSLLWTGDERCCQRRLRVICASVDSRICQIARIKRRPNRSSYIIGQWVAADCHQQSRSNAAKRALVKHLHEIRRSEASGL